MSFQLDEPVSPTREAEGRQTHRKQLWGRCPDLCTQEGTRLPACPSVPGHACALALSSTRAVTTETRRGTETLTGTRGPGVTPSVAGPLRAQPRAPAPELVVGSARRPPPTAPRGDLAQRPLSAPGLGLTRPPRPGRGRSPACCWALGAMASRDWAALLHGPGWEARRPPIAVTLPSLTRVLDGGPVSDGARAHVQMRLCGFKEGARLGGPAPPFATVLAHIINLIKVKLVLYIVSRK